MTTSDAPAVPTTPATPEAATGSPPVVPELLPRVSPAIMASARASGFFASRWLARIFTFGEIVISQDFRLYGLDSPVIAVYAPEIGPALAESAVGVPVNWALRPHDGLRMHWWPDGPGKWLRGIHPEVCAGFVERAWADPVGVSAILAIFRPECDADLAALERDGALEWSGVCLVQNVDALLMTSPWGVTISHVSAARAISVDFNSIPLRPGSRIVRRLALDEEPDEREVIETEQRLVPRGWRGAAMTPAPATVGLGSVGAPQIADNAVDTSKRQDVNSSTHSPTWPSGGSGVVKSVEYSVSVSISENYQGSWWFDIPSLATFSATEAYGVANVVQSTSQAKAWATTSLNVPVPTAVLGTFYYW